MINQDEVYLDSEANNFFNRNKYDFDKLPDWKKQLVDYFLNYLDEKEISNILEIGCNIGDLLNYSVKTLNAKKGYGIDPSSDALKEGKKRFPQNCQLIRGIAAQDEIFENIPECNLVIVNDVFSWISRASILRSIANIDEHVSDNGYIIIRDYVPNRFIRNQNRHVENHEVFCHKIIGSHAEIFMQIGNYQVLSSRIFVGSNLNPTTTRSATFSPEYSLSENRWIDILLQKKWE
jgi:SAM-dependent methyltransferase